MGAAFKVFVVKGREFFNLFEEHFLFLTKEDLFICLKARPSFFSEIFSILPSWELQKKIFESLYIHVYYVCHEKLLFLFGLLEKRCQFPLHTVRLLMYT